MHILTTLPRGLGKSSQNMHGIPYSNYFPWHPGSECEPLSAIMLLLHEKHQLYEAFLIVTLISCHFLHDIIALLILGHCKQLDHILTTFPQALGKSSQNMPHVRRCSQNMACILYCNLHYLVNRQHFFACIYITWRMRVIFLLVFTAFGGHELIFCLYIHHLARPCSIIACIYNGWRACNQLFIVSACIRNTL